MASHEPLAEQQMTDQQYVERAIAADDSKRRMFAAAGLTAIAFGATIAGLEVTGALDHVKSEYDVPYVAAAQHTIESVDNILAGTGAVVIPGALMIFGGTMLRDGPRNRWSANTLDSDGKAQTWPRRALQYASAGSVPVMASLGAGLATFSTAIGGAITDGPSQPIESISQIAPGDAWIVQDENAKPMVQSNLTPALVGRVMRLAQERDIAATPFALHLGDITYKGHDYANLSVGVSTPETSSLHWYTVDGCNKLPIAVDKSANIPIGETVNLDGLQAVVKAHTTETSAINRVGVLIDDAALANCITKTPENMHAITLQTSTEEARSILDEANTGHEAATVITKQHYIENSQDFWRSNVKPITNVLSLVAFGLAGVAMAKDASSRLFRSKRQWAQKLADGMSDSTIRATEFARSVKEGVFASALGVTGAALATPMVGVFEAGLHVAVDMRSMLVGGAVGIVGPVAGTMSKLVRRNGAIDKSEDTRGN